MARAISTQAKAGWTVAAWIVALLIFFPAGLVLYQLTNTTLSIAQQWRINKIVARESAAAS